MRIFLETLKGKFSHTQLEGALVVLLRCDHLVEESPTSLHRGCTEGQQQAAEHHVLRVTVCVGWENLTRIPRMKDTLLLACFG